MAPEFGQKPDGIVFGLKRWIAEKIINNKKYKALMKDNIKQFELSKQWNSNPMIAEFIWRMFQVI